MTRHGRNCTASAVYSYHEKKKDQKRSGFGSIHGRISKHGLKPFDCCSLTLQPCRYPVVTPDGYLYDKEAILEYILKKKKENAKLQKAYDKQCKKEQKEVDAKNSACQNAEAAKFLEKESSIVTKSSINTGESSSGQSVSNIAPGREGVVPSFWIPQLTPNSSEDAAKKPPSQVLCPLSGRPLRLKEMVEVSFTPLKRDAGETARNEVARERRYVCAVTNDVLSDSAPCVVLRKSGKVVTQECVDKLIRKEMLDPLTGEALKESDLIQLQRG